MKKQLNKYVNYNKYIIKFYQNYIQWEPVKCYCGPILSAYKTLLECDNLTSIVHKICISQRRLSLVAHWRYMEWAYFIYLLIVCTAKMYTFCVSSIIYFAFIKIVNILISRQTIFATKLKNNNNNKYVRRLQR